MKYANLSSSYGKGSLFKGCLFILQASLNIMILRVCNGVSITLLCIELHLKDAGCHDRT